MPSTDAADTIVGSDGVVASDSQPLARFNVFCIAKEGTNSSRGNSGGGGRVGIEFFQQERTPEYYAQEATRQAILSALEDQEVLIGSALVLPSIHLQSSLTAGSVGGVFPPTNRFGEARSDSGVAAGLAAGMRVVGITTTYEDLSGVSLHARNFDDPVIEHWLAQNLG